MLLRRFVAVLALCLSGCGGVQNGPTEPFRGNFEGSPSMEILPASDVAKAQLSKRFRFALLLTEESFEVPPPIPPGQVSAAQIQAWADADLAEWLRKKNEMVEAARAELDKAAEEAHRQRIMAGAMVGLMYEDVARVLLDVPLPSELESEPDIAQIYRENVAFQAKPYVEFARRAYRACALNAVYPVTMRHWSGFCAERRDRLPVLSGEEPESGETVVTVSVE